MDVAACVTSSPGAWPGQRSCGRLVGAILRSDPGREGVQQSTRERGAGKII